MLSAGWDLEISPFHEGELAIQERLGVRVRMDAQARNMVRRYLPDQHRKFYGALPYLLFGSVDAAGRPWASILDGRPGFIASPDERTLAFTKLPSANDPLAAALEPGARLGLLGIDLSNRRRNRVNGIVRAAEPGGLVLEVEQAFGNCPQYIQTRDLDFVESPVAETVETFTGLDEAARGTIARADTFFVATAFGANVADGVRGVDVSHRGGKPGFVRVDADGTLTIPDFSGNKHYNTLGNIAVYPRAGLLFADFASGDLLQLTGIAEVVWDKEEAARVEGAELLWRFRPEQGIRRRGALRWRGRLREASPYLDATGIWQAASPYRPWRVARIEDETPEIRSFYFEPADEKGLPAVTAGQFLPIRIEDPEARRRLARTYTLSSGPADPWLRISVKREGRVSSLLHATLAVGDLVEAKAPQGAFTLSESERPALMIGAGIGITPLLAMLRHTVAENRRAGRKRQVRLFQVARDRASLPFQREITSLVAASGSARHQVHLTADAGRPDMASLQPLLPCGEVEVYLCGPGGFMQAIYDGLRDLGVPDERIHAEAFGPSSLTRSAGPAQPGPAPVARAELNFTRSGRRMSWTPEHGTLLEAAEAAGIDAAFSCRSGSCGTCAVHLKQGEVAYTRAVTAPLAAREVLACSTVPASAEVEIDL